MARPGRSPPPRPPRPGPAWLATLETRVALHVECSDVALEDEARAWLRLHDERPHSSVDATSFALMRRLRISDALAFDGDFAAAGFNELRAYLIDATIQPRERSGVHRRWRSLPAMAEIDERGAPPTAAWVGAWLALAIVALPVPAAIVVSLGGFGKDGVSHVVGFASGWLLVTGAAAALGCGVVGLVRSLARRSASGVVLSLVPLVVVGLGLFLVFGG